MRRVALLFFFMALISKYEDVSAQLVVENNLTVVELIESIFVGQGVTVSNVTFNGVPGTGVKIQAGYFNSSSSNIPITSGIILASGDVDVAIGPNNSGGDGSNEGGTYQDDDLNAIATASTNNAAVLEFDFIPAGDFLSFDYVFASEEYNEYVCSAFNDVFGFFLSGPGISGPYENGAINIAIIPETNLPVAINNVNNGSFGTFGSGANCNSNQLNNTEYYIDNENNSSNSSTQYDGFTVTLQAEADVECGQSYHIKLAIADAADAILDSGVFLKEGSFSSNFALTMDLVVTSNGDANLLYEECGEGYLVFERVVDITDEAWFYLDYSGTATNGTDHTYLPDSLMFPAGDTVITYDIEGFPDDVIEGIEFANLQLVNYVSVCGSTPINSFVGFEIVEAPPIQLTTFDPVIGCQDSVLLDPQATAGYGDYSYLWSTGDTSSTIWVQAGNEPITYTITVNDSCGVVEVVDSFTVSLTPFPPLVVFAGEDDTAYSCLDTLVLNGFVSGGDQNYTFLWLSELDTIAEELGGITVNVTDPTIFQLIVTDGCDTAKSDEVEFINIEPPPLLVNTGPPDTSYSCLDSILVFGVVSGGTPGYIYEWIDDGNVVGTTPFYFAQITEQTTITLNVTDACGQTDSSIQDLYYFPPPMFVYAGEDLTSVSCDDTLTLNAIVSGGAGRYYYEWVSDNNLISNDSVFDITITYSQTLVLTVSDQCGTSLSDEIVLNSELTPVIPSIIGETEVCYDDPLSFVAGASGGAPPYTYLWSDGTTDNELNLIADTSTTYTVVVTDFCGTIADTSSLYIDVEHPIAGSSFDYTSDIFTIQLLNSSQPDELQYYWDFGDFTSSTDFEPTHEFLDSEDHIIILSVSTARGCLDVAELLYKAPAMIYIPNAFTPNGDGLNDYISIEGANINSVRMQIFDRWGKQVHELNSKEDKWYGSRKNGDTEYTSAVFNYVVEWTDYRDETFRQTGSILLIN